MKINPWIVVSLLALACGFLLGSRVENEAEAEAPRYTYFLNADGQHPADEKIVDGNVFPMFVRVDNHTGMYQRLIAGRGRNADGDFAINRYRWIDRWNEEMYEK